MTTLPGLLPELLLEICDWLLPADRECLSLCNHRLCELCRAHYRLPRGGDDELSTLARLERDLPEYFACHICNKLHRYDGSESFALRGIAHEKASRLPCDNKGYGPEIENDDEFVALERMSSRTHAAYDLSASRLSIHQLKLAMRRFHYGAAAGASTDSLSYTQIRIYTQYIPLEPDPAQPNCERRIEKKVPTLFSRGAQICPKPLGLHFRMQDILLFETWEDLKVDSPSNPIKHYEICTHTSLKCRWSDIIGLEEGKEPFFTRTCRWCTTVCVIGISELDSKIALIMTRWLNLGPGLGHDDPLWRVHIDNCEGPAEPLHNSITVKNSRLFFEGLTSEPFEELRSRNLSYLRGRQYENGKQFVKKRKDL